MASSTENDKFFEQYKIIVDSINQLNNMREYSNPFWLTANGLTISGISYLNTVAEIASLNKNSLLVALVFIGYLFCLVWLNYLSTIRRSLALRYELLMEIEEQLPIKFIQKVYEYPHKKEGKWSFTFSESLIPRIFLGAYTFFLIEIFYRKVFS